MRVCFLEFYGRSVGICESRYENEICAVNICANTNKNGNTTLLDQSGVE